MMFSFSIYVHRYINPTRFEYFIILFIKKTRGSITLRKSEKITIPFYLFNTLRILSRARLNAYLLLSYHSPVKIDIQSYNNSHRAPPQ